MSELEQQLTYSRRLLLETQVAMLSAHVPDALATETYQNYLVRLDLLGHGFSFSEVVSTWSLRRRMPPRKLWPRMALTLATANLFRHWCRENNAANGLRVAATYRPLGGARRSQHKTNAAIDLDRIGGDGKAYFEVAVEFWCNYAKQLSMGLGLYTAGPLSKGGIRVHIDTGYYPRSWHGIGRGFGRPYTIDGKRYGLPVFLAHRMGLDVPTLRDI